MSIIFIVMKKSKLSLNEEIKVIRRLSGLNEGLVDDIVDKLKSFGGSVVDKFEDFIDGDSDEENDEKKSDDEKIEDFLSDNKEIEDKINKIVWPTCNSDAKITSDFNEMRGSEQHKGVDISVNSGTKIVSPFDGKVEVASFTNDRCGGMIQIKQVDPITNEKTSMSAKFCHMKQIDVSVGDTVMAGEVVGLSGGGASDKGAGNSKGAHLHFELLDGNRHVNPEKTIKDRKFCPKPN